MLQMGKTSPDTDPSSHEKFIIEWKQSGEHMLKMVPYHT